MHTWGWTVSRRPSAGSTTPPRGRAASRPSCAHRDRYRREFTADLYDLPSGAQLRYATQVLSRSWSLRAALGQSTHASIAESTMSKPRAPLSCRLHLWHHWKTHHTEDGGRYVACARCHKEMPRNGLGDNTIGV